MPAAGPLSRTSRRPKLRTITTRDPGPGAISVAVLTQSLASCPDGFPPGWPWGIVLEQGRMDTQLVTMKGGAMAPARGKALLVDDSATVRSVLRSMLEEDGIQVVEAQDGAEGLERLRSDPSIGLVFLDVNMPGLSGLAMLRLVRADRDLDALPVVLLTGSSPARFARAPPHPSQASPQGRTHRWRIFPRRSGANAFGSQEAFACQPAVTLYAPHVGRCESAPGRAGGAYGLRAP